jgi:sec-independent protein translocase protein TatA
MVTTSSVCHCTLLPSKRKLLYDYKTNRWHQNGQSTHLAHRPINGHFCATASRFCYGLAASPQLIRPRNKHSKITLCHLKQEDTMGWRGINLSSLLIIMTLVILLFGTKKLRHSGGDIAQAIKDFKQGLKDKPKDNPHV